MFLLNFYFLYKESFKVNKLTFSVVPLLSSYLVWIDIANLGMKEHCKIFEKALTLYLFRLKSSFLDVLLTHRVFY